MVKKILLNFNKFIVPSLTLIIACTSVILTIYYHTNSTYKDIQANKISLNRRLSYVLDNFEEIKILDDLKQKRVPFVTSICDYIGVNFQESCYSEAHNIKKLVDRFNNSKTSQSFNTNKDETIYYLSKFQEKYNKTKFFY